MKFYAATEIVKSFDEDPELEYWMPNNKVYEIIEGLREEYAPTVEMTQEQYEILVLSRNNAVNRVDKVGLLEFMSAYALLNQEIDHLRLMQAWLHPETIKVVDE